MSSFEKWMIAGVGVLAVAAVAALVVFGLGLVGGRRDGGGGAAVHEPAPGNPPRPKAKPRFDEIPRGARRSPGGGGEPAASGEAEPMGGGSIAGRVVDRNGAPFAGVAVRLVRRAAPGALFSGESLGGGTGEESSLGEIVTGADGGFRFPGLEPGGGYLLEATYQGYASAKMAGLRVSEGEETRTRPLILVVGGTVRGTVTDESGAPVAGAKVLVLVQRHLGAGIWKTPGPTARSDGSGAYEVRNVPPGRKVVFAGAEGYATDAVYDVVIEDASLAEGVDFALERGRTITGTVLESQSEVPLEGLKVFATPVFPTDPSRASAETDASGRFTLTGLSTKSFRVRCSGEGYVPSGPQIAQGGMDLLFYLERNGGIRGQVVDGATGKPVPAFSIRYGEAGAERIVGMGRRLDFEDPSGSFEILDLNPKTYLLEVWAEGYAFTRSDPIVVPKGSWVDGVTLALGQGGGVEGTIVRAADGSPVAGATAMVRPGDRMDPFFHNRYNPYLIRESPPTGPDGHFLVENVGEGNFWLQVDHPDFAKKVVQGIQIRAGDRLDLGRIEILAGGVVEGTVRSPDGAPVFRAQILLSGEGYRNRVRTDRDGLYRFAKVPAGSYVVSVERLLGMRRDSIPYSEQPVLVSEGSRTTIDF